MAKVAGALAVVREQSITTVFAIVQAIALAVFAYWLKDRVDEHLKERAQIVSSIKEMQAVLDKLRDPAQSSDREENFVRLAMFGEDAVPVLVNLAAANTKYDQNTVLHALDLLVVDHVGAVCHSLRAVVAHAAPFDTQRIKRIGAYEVANCAGVAK